MAPRVFISHSCKDDELAAPPPADAAGLARRARLTYARTVRTLIKEKLEADGFEVWLDVSRLDPGDEWRAKLHLWLETCDAGIILLNEEAVASAWVRKETDILMHRWSLARSFESQAARRLRVVPVFLGAFSSDDLVRVRFGDLEVLSAQAARLREREMTDPNAAQLADQVLEGLRGFTPVTRDPQLQRWLGSVQAGLNEVRTRGEDFLDEARKRARVCDADWVNPAARVQILAHHLLHCDLATVKAALAELRPAFLNAGDYRAFASRLLPLWVDEALARGLVEARDKVSDARETYHAVALNAGQFETVRDYINRAWGYPSWGGRCVDFEPPVGEDLEAEVLTSLDKALAHSTAINRVTPAILTKFLAADPFFVTVGPELQAPGTLLRAMAARYSTVTFVVLAGTDFEALADGSVIARVEPPLGDGVEDTAAATKGEILQLQ